MSSGSQNGTTVAGLQGMRLRDASDVVAQTRLRLMFTTNNQSNSKYNGVNAYRSKGMQNSYNFLLQVQQGLREWNGGVQSNVGMGNGINWAVAGDPATTATISTGTGTTITLSNTTIPARP